MELSAVNEIQTWESSTLNSDTQNITNRLESSTTANRLDNLTQDQRLMPVHSHTTEPSVVGQSGIVPGIIAAMIFIAFLLGLYTILWKCMSFQAKRHKGNGRSRQKVHQSAVVSC